MVREYLQVKWTHRNLGVSHSFCKARNLVNKVGAIKFYFFFHCTSIASLKGKDSPSLSKKEQFFLIIIIWLYFFHWSFMVITSLYLWLQGWVYFWYILLVELQHQLNLVPHDFSLFVEGPNEWVIFVLFLNIITNSILTIVEQIYLQKITLQF